GRPRRVRPPEGERRRRGPRPRPGSPAAGDSAPGPAAAPRGPRALPRRPRSRRAVRRGRQASVGVLRAAGARGGGGLRRGAARRARPGSPDDSGREAWGYRSRSRRLRRGPPLRLRRDLRHRQPLHGRGRRLAVSRRGAQARARRRGLRARRYLQPVRRGHPGRLRTAAVRGRRPPGRGAGPERLLRLRGRGRRRGRDPSGPRAAGPRAPAGRPLPLARLRGAERRCGGRAGAARRARRRRARQQQPGHHPRVRGGAGGGLQGGGTGRGPPDARGPNGGGRPGL
ncbi:MAG: Orotidine 5'-phosphate decarboxylase, partial [uncultured Rubrobacteraceae bacterium]